MTEHHIAEQPRAFSRPRHVRVIRCLTLQLALILVFIGVGNAAHAALLQVNTTVDTFDGLCQPLAQGDCSLRDAVYAANLIDDLDFIVVPAGRFLLTRHGSDDTAVTGDLDITHTVFISGQGPEATIIDATGLNDRVLHVVSPGEQVTVVGVTITGASHGAVGGGIYHADGTLVLSNVTVADNVGDNGGGVYASGDLQVKDGSVIRGNRACSGCYGGGIYIGNADLTVTDSTITGNQAQQGGGILAASADGTVSGSTISYNTGLVFSGGMHVGLIPTYFEVNNSTFFGNSSPNYAAVYSTGSGNLTLHSVTIHGNSEPQGRVMQVNLPLTLINTIITGYCVIGTVGSVTSEGGNLESPLATCGLDHGEDQTGVIDPMLGPLTDYGGPTRTVLPLAGSPAINNGTSSYCLSVDQRGLDRNVGLCDAGAVERQDGELDAVFVDGFESGDTTHWSVSVPK